MFEYWWVYPCSMIVPPRATMYLRAASKAAIVALDVWEMFSLTGTPLLSTPFGSR